MRVCCMYDVRWLQACSKFVNCNAVTKQARGSSKSPELLARYCDTLLKKSAKNPDEAEMEDALQAVVSGRVGGCCVGLQGCGEWEREGGAVWDCRLW